jgi:hypothetical protein
MPQWQWHGINKSIRGCIRGKMAMQDKMCLRLKEWNKGETSGSLSSIFKGNWRYLDYIEIKWVEAYAVFIIQNKELSCSCRILASPAAPPRILDRHPNHQVGLIIFGPTQRKEPRTLSRKRWSRHMVSRCRGTMEHHLRVVVVSRSSGRWSGKSPNIM